jgi:hypothetical protein
MKNLSRYIPWSIRIAVSALFLLSAIAKLYPNPYFALSTFEAKQLIPLGFSQFYASYFSRILIGVELSLGILLLLPFYLKKLVIPGTILMLLVFIVHLSISILSSGNQGNCGCFGALLPMTPVQALIKNLVSVALLLVLFKKFEGDDRPKLMHLLNVVLASILFIFLVGPMKSIAPQPIQITDDAPTEVVAPKMIDTTTVQTVKGIKKDSIPVYLGPKKTKSGFSNIFPNIDSGKKLLCFFAPSCDHCRATAKALTEMKKANKDFPAIQIIFMDEAPEEIPDFFKFAGAEYPNYVMDIVTFWSKLGNNRDVPGVFYLWNGSTQKIYHGTEDQKFNATAFKKILDKEK